MLNIENYKFLIVYQQLNSLNTSKTYRPIYDISKPISKKKT
jgi:hypothetical protein